MPRCARRSPSNPTPSPRRAQSRLQERPNASAPSAIAQIQQNITPPRARGPQDLPPGSPRPQSNPGAEISIPPPRPGARRFRRRGPALGDSAAGPGRHPASPPLRTPTGRTPTNCLAPPAVKQSPLGPRDPASTSESTPVGVSGRRESPPAPISTQERNSPHMDRVCETVAVDSLTSILQMRRSPGAASPPPRLTKLSYMIYLDHEAVGPGVPHG